MSGAQINGTSLTFSANYAGKKGGVYLLSGRDTSSCRNCKFVQNHAAAAMLLAEYHR